MELLLLYTTKSVQLGEHILMYTEWKVIPISGNLLRNVLFLFTIYLYRLPSTNEQGDRTKVSSYNKISNNTSSTDICR